MIVCDKSRLAIILTCYNRKELSLRCVSGLLKAIKKSTIKEYVFYVWDDGSTDGTVEALELEFKSAAVRIYRGPGNYYWSKSMNAAMAEAIKDDYDLYLMINDDVDFYEGSLALMLDDYQRAGGLCGIVGSTRYNGEYTYGGRDRKYNGIVPNGTLQRCTYSNWNCFLIDREVVARVGLICDKYEHAWGDYDYSSRMNHKKIPQYIASDYIGECEKNHSIPEYLNRDIGVTNRIRVLFSPKGEPIRSFFRFHWVDKHFKGILIAIYAYLLLLARVIF